MEKSVSAFFSSFNLWQIWCVEGETLYRYLIAIQFSLELDQDVIHVYNKAKMSVLCLY